jgi:hypothetical protein
VATNAIPMVQLFTTIPPRDVSKAPTEPHRMALTGRGGVFPVHGGRSREPVRCSGTWLVEKSSRKQLHLFGSSFTLKFPTRRTFYSLQRPPADEVRPTQLPVGSRQNETILEIPIPKQKGEVLRSGRMARLVEGFRGQKGLTCRCVGAWPWLAAKRNLRESAFWILRNCV